jgi:hypothetical protein
MTIARVTKENEWEGKFGKNQAYSLDLKLADGTLEMGVTSNRKLKDDGSHNEPKEGEAIWGDILPDGRGGEKLKMDYTAMKENGSGSSSRPSGSSAESKASSGGGWKPESQYDPEKTARIGRAHAQDMAIALLGLPCSDSASLDKASLKAVVIDWTDFFERDVNEAGEKAAQGAATAKGAATPPSPPDIVAPRPEQPSAVIDEGEIEKALDTAGLVNAGARSSVALWMATELPEERVLKAIRNLTDPGAGLQAKTLEALKSNTEKHLGGPLPKADSTDEEIPF